MCFSKRHTHNSFFREFVKYAKHQCLETKRYCSQQDSTKGDLRNVQALQLWLQTNVSGVKVLHKKSKRKKWFSGNI